MLEQLDDECVVAAALHAEQRTAEQALRERRPGRAKAIERTTRVRREKNPRRAGAVVERESMSVGARHDKGVVTAMMHGDVHLSVTARCVVVIAVARRSTTDRRRRRTTRRFGMILDANERRLVVDQTTHAAAGERSPQFDGQEQRECRAGREQSRRSLDEQRGDVDLRRESATRSGVSRTGFPRCTTRDVELTTKVARAAAAECRAVEPTADCRRSSPKPPRDAMSAKCTGNEKGSAPPDAIRRRSARSDAARRRSVAAIDCSSRDG